MKDRRVFLPVLLSLVLLFSLILPVEAKSGRISWFPEGIELELFPGTSTVANATFVADDDFTDVSLWVASELQQFIHLQPQSFDRIDASVQQEVVLLVSIPYDTAPDTYKGTLHIRVGRKTVPQPLKITLYIEEATPGEPLNLEHGCIVSGADGASVGAPQGTLSQAIGIFIEKVDDPSVEVPFPDYLLDAEVVGDFYLISGQQDFNAPDDHYLILGLPVPDGVSTDDLVFVVLVPPDSIVVDKPDDSPSLRWIPLSGVYDPEAGLFATILPSMLTSPQVFALLDSSPAGWDTWTDSGHFRVDSIGFNSTECPEAHRVMTGEALNDAYEAYVERMDFLEPDLRNPVEHITFFPGVTVTVDVELYEYQLQRGNPNGFYDPTTRTAGTTYWGAPDTPNTITPHHELFHAIQFAYPAIRANPASSEKRRTLEAAAVAAELSLDGLTRSSRNLTTRDPLPVTRGLWSTSEALSYGYRAQDFLVYLGNRIMPEDPQLSFMIPWFEEGSLVADLDTVLQADSTFDSLGDAYWDWVKNQAFEKQVILGTDRDGEAVPNGEACSWSGHGDLKYVSFSPETWIWGGDDTDFTLEPLTSRVFELTLNPGDSSYDVEATIDSADPNVEFKFYESGDTGGEGCWDGARDSVSHTFYVEEEYVMGYLLVSNTNVETVSDTINLVAVVEFPDPGLEAAIREAIGKPMDPIYRSDLDMLTFSLFASDRNITDLTGLEYCTNLVELLLDNNQISDISPLTNLTSLMSLELWSNQISNLSPLASLNKLEILYLDDNRISNLSPLANLTNLPRLYLGGNQISDLSPLANLTNLKQLGLDSNQISNLSPLASLNKLEILYLGDNQISDLSPLANLINLNQILGLGANQISDISPLANLTGLTQLHLGFNSISDLSPLANLINLRSLSIAGNQISDVSPLTHLTNLTQLDLYTNQIKNVSPLTNLTNLTYLNLCKNQISNISPLSSLTKLGQLSLCWNNIFDISALVANSGLGSGDMVNLRYNYLDITAGSKDMNDIQALLNRGAWIWYDPQKEIPEP